MTVDEFRTIEKGDRVHGFGISATVVRVEDEWRKDGGKLVRSPYMVEFDNGMNLKVNDGHLRSVRLEKAK